MSGKLRRVHIHPDDNPYGRNVVFIYGTRDQVNAYMRKACKGENEEMAGVATHGAWRLWEHSGGHLCDYIAVIKRRTLRSRVASLGHEVAHHVFNTMERAGIHVTMQNDEPFCYYHQWVMVRCLAVMMR